MTPISAAQMRKIHVIAREQGMDNDLLHIYVENVTGKDSLKKLDVREAVKVIDGLTRKASGDGGNWMTRKQSQYIADLMKKLGWVDDDGKPDYKRLDGFCKKRFSVESHKWLTSSMASKVIEGLKNMSKKENAS